MKNRLRRRGAIARTRGYPVRAVGTSDSHGIDGSEPGYTRTYVLYDGLKGANLDQAALPYALTNPIFVDVDGNGTCDPIRPGKVIVK